MVTTPCVLRVDAASGVRPNADVVTAALAAQRSRLLDLFRSLDDEQWRTTSRCDEWTVHEVARHLTDVLAIDTAQLTGQAPAFPSDQPFDPRTTPKQWLDETRDHGTADTIATFEARAAAEADALARASAALGDTMFRGPFGRIHWSAFMAHVFWDAWLHERDIVTVLDMPHRAAPHEDRLAALYGLLVAAVAPSLAGAKVDTTIELRGEIPLLVHVVAADGGASATVVNDATPALSGELGATLDTLAGRGPTAAEVVDGPADILEPFTWLRAFLVSS